MPLKESREKCFPNFHFRASPGSFSSHTVQRSVNSQCVLKTSKTRRASSAKVVSQREASEIGEKFAKMVSCMLFRAFRFTSSRLPPSRSFNYIRLMSASAPPTEGNKRALSPSAPISTSINSTTSPDSKRAKLSSTSEDATASTPATSEAPTLTAKQNRKIAGRSNNNNGKQGGGRKSKVKAPKPGGVEEAGAFDVIELLGAERVEEMQKMESEEGKDWRKAAEEEWGSGPNGKDVELNIVGINSHGESRRFHSRSENRKLTFFSLS
jgi:hypothetical protein